MASLLFGIKSSFEQIMAYCKQDQQEHIDQSTGILFKEN